MSQWHAIYQAINSLEAHMLRGALQISGIEVQLQGEALAGALGELPVNAIEVSILVKGHQVAQAQQILLDYQQQNKPTWHCAQCGEGNAGSFEICWQCGQDPTTPRSSNTL